MDSNKIVATIPVAADCGEKYRGMTFDGCYFYLTIPAWRKIYQYDCRFDYISCFSVSKPYEYLCYDSTDCCFWASCESDNQTIYTLDQCFANIGQISLEPDGIGQSRIVGLTYDSAKDRLLAIFPRFVAGVEKDTGSCSRLFQTSCKAFYLSAAALSPCFTTACIKNSKQMISVYSDMGQAIRHFYFPRKHVIQAMVLCSPDDKEEEPVCYILACQHCSFCIIKCKISCVCCQPEVCCEQPCPCKCEYNLISSVALVETAISHILNAEGEKLQKAVACASQIEELLAVNQSIHKTIIHVTHLEQVLYAKLQAIEHCCQGKSSTSCVPAGETGGSKESWQYLEDFLAQHKNEHS